MHSYLYNIAKLCFKISLGSIIEGNQDQDYVVTQSCDNRKSQIAYDVELYSLCMKRFLYIRCYDSFEFLATLKVRIHVIS